MVKLKITKQEIILAVTFALLGAIFSMKGFLMFLNTLNPFFGLCFYYAIVIVALLIMSYFGLVIFNISIEKPLQVIGATLIVFSFFLVFNFTNGYVSAVITGSPTMVPNIFLGSEDGATFWLWSHLTTNLFALRILTFILTPGLLALLGGLLVERKIELSP